MHAAEGRRPRAFWASLTYIPAVKTRPITVAETQLFGRAAEKIWSEDERAELID